MRPRLGQGEKTEVTAVNTSTIEVLERAPNSPEWRRLCHYYFPGTLRSACGTASRPPGEGHCEDECAARGHTICVVCTEIWEGVYPS
jgi:hypothetical protein